MYTVSPSFFMVITASLIYRQLQENNDIFLMMSKTNNSKLLEI